MLRIGKTIILTAAAVMLLAGCSAGKYKPLETEASSEEAGLPAEETEEVIEVVSIPKTVYVRVPCNLLTAPDENEPGAFVSRGDTLTVLSMKEKADGLRDMYEVSFHDETGWIGTWYVCNTPEEARRPETQASGGENAAEHAEDASDEAGSMAAEDADSMPDGSDQYYYTINSVRGNKWGGGTGADADYYARDKEFTPNRVMPERVKAIYLCGWLGGEYFDEFVEIAKNSGINAFVINILDNTEVAYPSEVMKAFCPSAYEKAINSRQHYADCIQRLKDEGFYVIGRMTTFQDDYLALDHPELTICDLEGHPKTLANGYWPTAYSRKVWEYKLDIAEEAVKWFDFDEIQFDYVRFPDRTQSAEKEGNIDYRNPYGETKVQAIQRFMMYACDRLHAMGVYMSADVFGEVSEGFVGGYGQYWPAISNVADVISAMPYPDHYEGTEEYKPWEHPYETIKKFAEEANERQKECPTPAKVRTWLQGYNAYKEPHTEFYAENVGKEIQALYDAGITDGWMIWNGANSIKHCRLQAEAFSMEP